MTQPTDGHTGEGDVDDGLLTGLQVGRQGTVVSVAGEDVLARRLRDLGFWPGTEVHVIRRAPFGDPTQYWLRGYRVALRRDEASRVCVTPGQGAR